MCGSMVDIQSATAEIRRGKKEEGKKPQGKNIMSASALRAAIKNCGLYTQLMATDQKLQNHTNAILTAITSPECQCYCG